MDQYDRRPTTKQIKQMERDIKQEQENHDSKQTNSEEVDKLMAYLAELGRQLAT